jgi:hypothetical protein
MQVGEGIRLIDTHDVHADAVRNDATGTVFGLSIGPKGSQSNELDLIIWIEWDHNKSSIALTEDLDQYEIIEKVG